MRGKGPALSPNTGRSDPCSCVTCCIKGVGGCCQRWGYKGECGRRWVPEASPACTQPHVRMTAALPCLALALLCVLRAAAEVPVQPGFDTQKVTKGRGFPQPVLCPQAPRGARVPESAPGQLPGVGVSVQTGLVLPSPCPRWPDPAMAPLQGHGHPALWCPHTCGISPGNTGQALCSPFQQRAMCPACRRLAGPCVRSPQGLGPHRGWQVPALVYHILHRGWQFLLVGGRSPCLSQPRW